MNRVFKSKFNKKLGAWVAVSELARGFSKNSKIAVVGIALVATAGIADAKQTINEEVEVTDSVVVKKNAKVDGSLLLNGFNIRGIKGTSGAGPKLVIDYLNPNPENPEWKPEYFNIQIGVGAFARGTQAYSIGQFSKADGKDDIAIGHYVKALGDFNSAFGYKTQASTWSVALGNYSLAQDSSFATGIKTYAFERESVSVGIQNVSYKSNSVAMGTSNTSTSVGAASVGVNNYAGQSNLMGFKDVNGVKTPRLMDVLKLDDAGWYEPISDKPEDKLTELFKKHMQEKEWSDFAFWENSGLTFTGPDDSNLNKFSQYKKFNLYKYKEEIYKALNEADKDQNNFQTALGFQNTATGNLSSSVGALNLSIGDKSSALGNNNLALGRMSSAVGASNTSVGKFSQAFGYYNLTLGEYSVGYGYYNVAENTEGKVSRAGLEGSVAIGAFNKVQDDAIGLGTKNIVSAGSIAVGGANRLIKKDISIKNNAIVEGNESTLNPNGFVFGYDNKLYAGTKGSDNVTIAGGQNFVQNTLQSSVFGYRNFVGAEMDFSQARPGFIKLKDRTTSYAFVMGNLNFSNASFSTVLGNENEVKETADYSVVLGDHIKADIRGAIYLGSYAKTKGYVKADVPEGKNWKWAANLDKARVMTIGSEGFERQIQHVAAGRINKDSTDAVNGSQLFAVADDLANKINGLTGQSPSIILKGDLGTKQTLPLSNVINIVGSNTTAGDLITGNIGVEVTKDGSVAIKLSKKLTGIESINFGDSVVLNKELVKKIQNFDPSSGGTGSSTKQLNIADDAGTKAQPKEDTVQLVGGAKDSSDNNIKTVVDTKDKEKVHIKLAKNLKGLESAEFVDENGNGTVITKDGIKTVVKEKDSEGKDVIKEIAMGTSYVGDDGNKVDIPLNKTLNIKGGATDVSTENNVGVVKGDDSTLNIRLSKNLKGIESIDGLKEMSYDDMQDSSNDNKAVSVKSMKNYIEKYGTPGGSGGSDFNGDAGGKEITNLKPGTKSNSAATVGQLEDAKREVRRDAFSGAAMAMAVANLPQSTTPGEKTVSIAAGVVEGRTGYAMGISSTSMSGKWKLRGSITGSDRGHIGGGIGAGYSWK
ncbi:YadA-like family protein [Taylorella equigenitalis]|uniref:YadA-like family protein n=1 Tax=Taylorella equigenitalis TaxID=29575 RepID=UPI00240DFDDF|nr:YadA-like family protein [Taylorella equigenitalis]WFD79855.1 YadA-like family protein [Taylorella equigenitalis]